MTQTHIPRRRTNPEIVHNGKRYRFAFSCAYMGNTDFTVDCYGGAAYLATVRHALSDYERSILNYQPHSDYDKTVESEIGILRRSVCDDMGEIDADTIAAFNAWREREEIEGRANFVARNGHEAADEFWPIDPPKPVHAGRYDLETRRWIKIEAAAAGDVQEAA